MCENVYLFAQQVFEIWSVKQHRAWNRMFDTIDSINQWSIEQQRKSEKLLTKGVLLKSIVANAFKNLYS